MCSPYTKDRTRIPSWSGHGFILHVCVPLEVLNKAVADAAGSGR